MSYEAQIAQLYRTYLGREPDAGGLAGYTKQANEGRKLSSIKKEIATSDEARDNVIRAQQAQQQAAQATAAANAAQSQLAQYQRDLERYSNDLSSLQTQYNTALGEVSSWQSKAGEYQTQAADWESKFNKRTEEWETCTSGGSDVPRSSGRRSAASPKVWRNFRRVQIKPNKQGR